MAEFLFNGAGAVRTCLAASEEAFGIVLRPVFVNVIMTWVNVYKKSS